VHRSGGRQRGEVGCALKVTAGTDSARDAAEHDGAEHDGEQQTKEQQPCLAAL
jgi:hypothetical protein